MRVAKITVEWNVGLRRSPDRTFEPRFMCALPVRKLQPTLHQPSLTAAAASAENQLLQNQGSQRSEKESILAEPVSLNVWCAFKRRSTTLPAEALRRHAGHWMWPQRPRRHVAVGLLPMCNQRGTHRRVPSGVWVRFDPKRLPKCHWTCPTDSRSASEQVSTGYSNGLIFMRTHQTQRQQPSLAPAAKAFEQNLALVALNL